MVPEIAGFGGAAGGIVFGVEVQHQFAPFKFRQGADLAVLVLGLEGRGWITDGRSAHGLKVYGMVWKRCGLAEQRLRFPRESDEPCCCLPCP